MKTRIIVGVWTALAVYALLTHNWDTAVPCVACALYAHDQRRSS